MKPVIAWNRLVTPVCRWESLAPIVPYDSIIHYYKPNRTYTCLCSCVPTPSFTQTIATNASTFGLVRSYPQKVIFSFKIVWLLYADCSIRYTTSSTPHERIAIEDVPGLWFAWRGGALIKWNIRFWKLIFYLYRSLNIDPCVSSTFLQPSKIPVNFLRSPANLATMSYASCNRNLSALGSIKINDRSVHLGFPARTENRLL